MKLLTLREAAELARMSPSSLRQQIAEARGPRITRLGSGRSRPLVREDCLAQWIAERTDPASAAE